jgi:hypothetical protein
MEKSVAVRPFVDTLREVRGGQCLDELSVKLNDLVAAVRQTGKSGEIGLRLKVSPAGSGAVLVVQVDDAITLKLPELSKQSTLFFPTEDNNLQRTDPRQRSMELEAVGAGKKPEAATA